ncbi:hypothetical protein ACVWZ6_006179 [Bradyrhizobium sp. GM6.1]
MPIQFTTDDSPGHRRLALWQDIVCDVFVGLDCRSDLGSAFRGTVTRAPLGKAECSEVCSDRQHVLRTPSRIARSDQDFILIALGNRGAGGVVQDGREAVVSPGEFALYDTTRPYELKFDGIFTQTIFKVPREMLQRRLGATETLTATSFGPDSPLQRIAYDFIYRLCQSADQIDLHHAAALSEQAVDVLAMALGERLGKTPLPSSTHRSALLYRLKAHIRAHLADPDLSLSETAAALGISVPLCQRSPG